MDNDKQRQMNDASYTIEFIAKYGGAVGLTALGTAIFTTQSFGG
jgi:hypothetical protein